MKRIACLIALAVLAAMLVQAAPMVPEQVRIDTGLLAGTISTGQPTVRVFKGIPFAAPPLGENRWRAPQPAARWDGVRKADAFAAPCIAGAPAAPRGGNGGGGGGRGAATPAAAPAAPAAPPREPARSEDCLYANVWTSAASANDRRGVMVWIYGGGFTGGSGSQAWYDGENLASKGPVVVTFNYRLGGLGWFAHPDLAKESGHNASGNYGMMDAIAMLQWVKRNISAFGGDPNNVTIAGESAGANMIGALVGSPQAKGLFHRAIAESGAWMGLTLGRMNTAAKAQEDGAKAMAALGVNSIAELRAKPLAELTGINSSGVVVDGYMVPQDLSLTYLSGKQNAVDLLSGSNKDEANFGLCTSVGLPGQNAAGGGRGGRGGTSPTLDSLKTAAQRRFGDASGEYMKLFAPASDEAMPATAHASCADEINWNMRQWAEKQAKLGKKAYVYFFTRIPTVNGQPSPQGANHTAEISYAFNNPKGQATQTWNETDTKLGGTMSSYWANFIMKGDPNGSGLPNWPQYRDLTSKVMVLGDTVQPESAPPIERLKFLSAAHQRMFETR